MIKTNVMKLLGQWTRFGYLCMMDPSDRELAVLSATPQMPVRERAASLDEARGGHR